jgi:hypothetical protein
MTPCGKADLAALGYKHTQTAGRDISAAFSAVDPSTSARLSFEQFFWLGHTLRTTEIHLPSFLLSLLPPGASET